MNKYLTCFLSLSLLGLLGAAISGCSDIVVQKTWTAPAVDSIHFTKIFVLCIGQTSNDMNRHLAENAVIAQIEKIPAVASFELLPDISDIKSKAKVLQAIKDSGADGLVVLRLLGTDTNVVQGKVSTSPMDYAVFSDYLGTVYDVGAFFSSDPRGMYVDKIFSIETKIYDAKTEKLIWSGRTESTKNQIKDHDVQGLVTEVAATVKSALSSQKLIR